MIDSFFKFDYTREYELFLEIGRLVDLGPLGDDPWKLFEEHTLVNIWLVRDEI